MSSLAREHPDLAALPVSLSLPHALTEQVQRHLEGALGWQVTSSSDLPARLHLVGAGRRPSPESTAPTLLVVTDQDRSAAAARAALDADDVIAWPDEADLLAVAAARLLTAEHHQGAPTIHVAGASGGVGTSTVVLGLGGLLAWSGRSVLVAGTSDLAVPDVPQVETLQGPRPWEVAGTVPGVPGLRCVATPHGLACTAVGPDVVLRDDRSVPPHVLVAATDRPGIRAALETPGAVILVQRGPLDVRPVARVLGSRLVATLPWSARVARAGTGAHVPAGLPGSWLQRLAPLASVLDRDLGADQDQVGVVHSAATREGHGTRPPA